ncbi:MAG TPA: DUF4198 domain-containing protein [Steroidobacteraceae bacterium]|nr:DUF4198 domain-containing protein [Steroidobacteraceae bacterium]
MNRTFARLALAAVLLPPAAGFAARPWLLPSQTIVARNGGWVTFDAANADDLFSFNQGAMPLDALSVSGPDGVAVTPQNLARGRTRSSFDLELRTPGTYRVAVAGDQVMARWEQDGKPKRWRGPAADMRANIPANAAKLALEQQQRRVETFVTVGSPTAVKPVGVGLELVPTRHPNDLYAGEAATFRFLLDGKPAKDLPVEIIAGGTRYRDAPEPMQFKTDQDGAITVTWPASGLYWLEAGITDEHATVPGVRQRSAAYDATLEVLPQ